ncbi:MULTISPECIES: type II secretion system major pseudopilin GspG [unclassified Pseudomonas]|uniref:type II secretion system major pseudopilin GspG n=1 Tax=unclassified Pseudomonas TaxID=196821 RepID=UPI00384E0D62
MGNFTRCASSLNPPSGHRRHAGFTLLELLVVLVVLGLLAGIVAPKYFSQLGRSQTKVARAQIEGLSKALDLYRLEIGHYPSTEQGLQALVVAPAEESHWTGPYLQKAVPQDPWGRSYVYRYPGENSEYDLLSMGKDGQPGGEGEDAEITNWQ